MEMCKTLRCVVFMYVCMYVCMYVLQLIVNNWITYKML